LAPAQSIAAIIGSGAPQAIIGSGAPQAIIGSGAPQAIIGSGAPQAIIGSGAPQAINGSGAPQVIIGSGAPQAIIGSGAPQAIIGSGAPQAIIGSGAPQAIIGSGAPQAIIGSGSPFELVVLGSVSDYAGTEMTVLGQTVFTSSATNFHNGSAATLASGRLAAVFGMVSETGIYASDVVFLPGRFVEGASTVLVSGYVTESSDPEGVFKLGALEVIPLEAGVSSEAWSVAANSVVKAEGVLVGGRLYASRVEAL